MRLHCWVQGKAANYVMGATLPMACVFKDGGMTNTRWASGVPGNHPGDPARRRSADRHDPHPGRRQECRGRQEVPRLYRHGRCGRPSSNEAARAVAAVNKQRRVGYRSVPAGGLRNALEPATAQSPSSSIRERAGRDGQRRQWKAPGIHGQAGKNVDRILDRLERRASASKSKTLLAGKPVVPCPAIFHDLNAQAADGNSREHQ